MIKNATRLLRLSLLGLSLTVLSGLTVAAELEPTESDPEFQEWLDELYQEAKERGISEQTLEQAFSEITPPVKRIIKTDRNQAEVVKTYDSYLSARLTDWKFATGRKLMAENAEVLDQVGAKYGVQPRFMVAIWGMETNYGTYPIKEPIFNVLATLAYDKRRGPYFRKQFLAALDMLDSGFPTYDELKSSWAGAMGQSQFMPESYHC